MRLQSAEIVSTSSPLSLVYTEREPRGYSLSEPLPAAKTLSQFESLLAAKTQPQSANTIAAAAIIFISEMYLRPQVVVI